MGNEPARTDLPAGNFISENPARGILGRRRRTSSPTTGHAVNDVPTPSSAAGKGASLPTGGARPLRRWSVGELIARAVATPPPST